MKECYVEEAQISGLICNLLKVGSFYFKTQDSRPKTQDQGRLNAGEDCWKGRMRV